MAPSRRFAPATLAHVTRAALFALVASTSACMFAGGDEADPVVDSASAKPGTSVARAGASTRLAAGTLETGKPWPSVNLYGTDFRPTKIAADGRVKIVSIVASVDTRLDELQTQLLATSLELGSGVDRVTVSRDLPSAQRRFAEESGLTEVRYLSDYRDGAFGRATGLLMESDGLLARAIAVVDGRGVVRYVQVVPEQTHLPDLARAFAVANELAEHGTTEK